MTSSKPVFQQLWHGKSEELVQKFKPGKVDCVITDPPFGVDNKSKSAVTPDGKAMARKIANDETPEIAIANFQRVMTELMSKMKDESDVYVFTAHQVLKEWLVMTDDFFTPYNFLRKAILVWEKDGPGQGDLDTWGMGCEFILYFKRGKRIGSDKRRNNVFHYPQIAPAKLIHPHEKPLPLLEDFIRHSTSPGGFVVDPFGGSCSVARACQRTGRSAVCIELDKFNYEQALHKYETGEGGGFDFG